MQQSAKDVRLFMKRVEEKSPFKVQTVLTDNGKSFTDRFTRAGSANQATATRSTKNARPLVSITV